MLYICALIMAESNSIQSTIADSACIEFIDSRYYRIYALVCPIDRVIKYVGCSRSPQKRLLQHYSSKNEYVKEWLRTLKSCLLAQLLALVRKFERRRKVDRRGNVYVGGRFAVKVL